MSRIDNILSFWFKDSTGATETNRKVWFIKNPEFDRAIELHFLEDYQQAADGKLDHWQETAEGCLALTLVLDQFPRNMFRGQPQSFATDAKALAIAQHAIHHGFDQTLPLIQRWFIYMPFMHSENLETQRHSVELFRQLADNPETQSCYPYAIKHLEVIERFRRFPHRNAILGRESTLEEIEFLKQPGSSF
ncbi:MAG: DUF924 domain-containing protein [Leptolyngbyaceae cyanobacterium RU_5_1]|nr:DUF924 domain-containing protein [Leptolyngbyaceae cyanobacterium RU_5_1]